MRARKTQTNRRRTPTPPPREAIEPSAEVPEVLDTEVVGPGRIASRWPLVAAFVPDPDTWRVSGAGRTLIARRRADGRIAWGALSFDLKRPSATLLFGDRSTEEGQFEEILDALFKIEDAPPLVGGSDRLASRFTFGALAYARELEPELDGIDESLLSVFEKPSPDELRRVFDGEDGLCHPQLKDRCREEALANLDPGQGLAVHVAMGFKLAEPIDFARALAKDSDFAKTSKGHFDWKPAIANGQRLGSVELVGDELEAETISLDLGGRLCSRLKRLANGGLKLVRVQQQPLD